MTPSEERELHELSRLHYQKSKCRAKKKFFSKAATESVISRDVRGHNSSKTLPKLWSYECRFCGFWHVTSSKPIVRADLSPVMEAA